MMSYQLPDLLAILASIDETGETELQIHDAYQTISNAVVSWTLDSLRPAPITLERRHQLQRSLRSFLTECDFGLLASTYFPLAPAKLNAGSILPSKVQIAAEWLSLCGIRAEEILRPGRISDYQFPDFNHEHELGEDDFGPLARHPIFARAVPHLKAFCSSPSPNVQGSLRNFVNASANIPSFPSLGLDEDDINAYLQWRISLSGLEVLFDLSASDMHFSEQLYDKVREIKELMLQVIICILDLFSYNVHRAWHRNITEPARVHLNLVAFWLAKDDQLVLQGVVNILGQRIQEKLRMIEKILRDIVGQPGLNGDARQGSFLSGLIPRIFPLVGAFSVPQQSTMALLDDDNSNILKIRESVFNWLTGTIHWVYEVDCFYPGTSDEGEDNRDNRRRKKRGEEVRDYGWVFLYGGERSG